MARIRFSSMCFFLVAMLVPQAAWAVGSAEFYTAAPYGYGRFEARIRFAAGQGVIGSFFLWKSGSEVAGTFWNELDFEKVGADCHVETNAVFGNPSTYHVQRNAIQGDGCSAYRTYAYEWTPDAIVWLVDGVEVRRETGETASAFAENAAGGMQVRFNVWPGDATFGGTFDPSTLPIHQYVDWVQFSSYADGAFTLAWREDFDSALPSGWATGNWGSPKNLSTHNAANVNVVDGYLVLSLTADDALGPAGAMPGESDGADPGGSGASDSSDSGGCSFGRVRGAHGTALTAVFGLFAVVARRRRRAVAVFSSRD